MNNFSEKLTSWYKINARDLPWRSTSDPYKIWLSEIILQQTRVNQGLNYYLKFENNFETVEKLAEASEDEVLKLWQGLGYYSRGRNLLKAAKQVVTEFNGVFPNKYKDLITLKGVGDYSASAIASFASNEKVAVVDGNVYRVLSRIFGVDTPIDSTEGKKLFKSLAEELLPPKNCATHNQAIMEFGALQCTPKSPNCEVCPFLNQCEAYNSDRIDQLPTKSKKIKKTNKYFHFFLFQDGNKIAFEKRNDQGIWANMYQLPLIETPDATNEYGKYVWTTKHVLTHQNLYCNFYLSQAAPKSNNLIWISKSEISKIAIPRVIDQFLIRLEII